MNIKRTGKIATVLIFGYMTLAVGATEDEIMKAMREISTTTVMKSSAPKIVSQSEPMVLSSDKVKVKIKDKVKVSRKQKSSKTKKRVRRKHKRVERVEKVAEMEDLPMAKSYPMSYDVSQITE